MARTTEAGNAAEAFVAGRLCRAGYDILDRNWRVRGGELDIVAIDREVLVFVEVKARTGERFSVAEEALSLRKLNRLMLAAELYVEAHPELIDHVWRVDFVAITLSADGAVERYSHVENVTLE
jgi:putative endonuclease